MPREQKSERAVKDWPDLSETRAYAVRVLSVQKNRKPAGILIGLEHLDDDSHEVASFAIAPNKRPNDNSLHHTTSAAIRRIT